MKVSREIVAEVLENIRDADLSIDFITERFEKIDEENPVLAAFINAVIEAWKSNKPATLQDQVSVLAVYLVATADIIARQEEVDKLNKQFGRFGS